MIINIWNTQIQLLPEKAIFLPEGEVLVIADMHLGKLVHFRKKGLFVPTNDVNEDLEVLKLLIINYRPKQVVFLGDLFHSELNSDHESFLKTIESFQNVEFILTKGNHDIIPKELFEHKERNIQVQIVDEMLLGKGVLLRHQLPRLPKKDCFYIIGHVHPGYVIQGRGRQTFRLPCFYKSENFLILPAFGRHTGLFISKLLPEDKSYVIINKEIILMK